jgi:hypothetical protein
MDDGVLPFASFFPAEKWTRGRFDDSVGNEQQMLSVPGGRYVTGCRVSVAFGALPVYSGKESKSSQKLSRS